MNERPVELDAILSEIKRRWTQRLMLRAWTLGAAAAATVIAVGFTAAFFVASEGLPLVFTAAVVAALSGFALARALWPLHRRPTDRQLARFIEEHEPALDDVVVTAVDYQSRPDASPSMRHLLAADAAAALSALDLDRIVSGDSIRESALRAVAASAALGLTAALFAPAFSRATHVAGAYLFPARLSVQVTPGSTKIRAGQPVTITARVGQLGSELVPTLTVAVKDESRNVRMSPGKEPGTFAVTIENVTAPFGYHVSAAGARSDDYTITVVRPPHVQRIDLRYEFPKGLGLEPRVDEDSGDIYGPAGTKVTVSVTTDKPIATAALALGDGTRVPLTIRGNALETTLTIDDDGSYRVALADHDGLESAGDTEYFIRTLDDRPPDVRILRPASDKQVTPLEEVLIEARADDDYGIESFELVFQTPAGKQRTVPLRGKKGGLTASGLHTLFMEELGVQPGDFVTYYARARDVNRGRRSTEARSDIFFLEVKPFEEEFVSAQSQAMGQGSGMQGDRSIEALIEAQKEIIVATWKLDARARRARDQASQQDIKAVSKAQSELRSRAEQMSAQVARTTGDPRRRRNLQGAMPGDDPIGRSVEAMGRAVNELDAVRTSGALPHEMEALNQLLKAAAENRRRQVTRGQQAGGGGGANRSEADLSSLFDQELRKRQQTNYETPNSTEEKQENKPDDLLDRIRELARRQDALNRQQRELARNREQIEEDELKRQLERLTREQNELRQQAEQMASAMQQRQQKSQQQSGQQSQGGQQQSGQQAQNGQSTGQGSNSPDGRRMREISEEMRNAATGLRRQDSAQAQESGSRASERLREFERQLQASRPDDRRRALGDLQLETRQLADSQRRLANEAGRTAQGQPGDDARRRLAGDQDRLAQRVDRLEEQVKSLSKSGAGEGDQRRATEEAARELEKQKLADRMRQSADSLRQGSGKGEPQGAPRDASRDAARQGEEVAQALDRIADRLGAASGADDANGRRLSDQLTRTQELRDKVDGLNRSIDELQREAQRQQEAQARGERADAKGSQGAQQGQANQGPQQGSQGQQAQSSGAQSSPEGREGASGQQGGSTGGQGGRLQQLQQEVNERMHDAERLAGELRRDNPSMRGPDGNDNWWRSFSAPGTEAFKQDFARWESLKSNLLVALESVDSKVSDELRARANKERLNAGGHDAVSEAYRELVEKYYRSLAAPRKPQ